VQPVDVIDVEVIAAMRRASERAMRRLAEQLAA
jgi:hypothetical protein